VTPSSVLKLPESEIFYAIKKFNSILCKIYVVISELTTDPNDPLVKIMFDVTRKFSKAYKKVRQG